MEKKSKKPWMKWLIAAALGIPFCVWQNNMLTVSEYTYSSEKVKGSLDGFRIVQISDLHNKSFGKGQKRILKKIKALDPDIIVVTGDIVDAYHTNIPRAVELVEGSCDIAPTYYITGNHETWLDDGERQELIDGIGRAGAVILSDEVATVKKGSDGFTLAGVDDLSLINFSDRCPRLDEAELNVVLAHEPQYIEDYGSFGNIDLVLSGHAHGGQFRLPFVGGIVAPDQGIFPRYTSGEYFSGNTEMIVSRGIGNSVIPLRLFNFPEIVVVEFEKK